MFESKLWMNNNVLPRQVVYAAPRLVKRVGVRKLPPLVPLQLNMDQTQVSVNSEEANEEYNCLETIIAP